MDFLQFWFAKGLSSAKGPHLQYVVVTGSSECIVVDASLKCATVAKELKQYVLKQATHVPIYVNGWMTELSDN